MSINRKEHWETVYRTKTPEQVSWTQDVPQASLDLIRSLPLEKNARIIDIGGGDSRLVDHLLLEGFTNITVLDISAVSLEKAKKRLGPRASEITWIVSDITVFRPDSTYDLWHDRATFHFLTEEEEINKYVKTAQDAVRGYMVIGTFSEQGPVQCSGLRVKRYSEYDLISCWKNGFTKIKCLKSDHFTPSGNRQNFLFCSFKRIKARNMGSESVPATII